MIDDVLGEAAAKARGVSQVRAHAGDVLFRPLDPCRGFIAVRRGAIKVMLAAPSGREIVLYRVNPGEVCLQTFSCLVQHKPYAAEGVAEEDLEALLIPNAEFDMLLAGDDTFRSAVLASVAERFADFENVVQMLAFTGLEARVAAALLRLAGAHDHIAMTHEALAEEIGSAREAVSRQLGLFARQGLVALSRGRIDLKARSILTHLAQAQA
jgi:CRP/FNR family transcriptional regulator